MKNLLTKIICSFFPLVFLNFLFKNKYAKNHTFPVSTLVHRKKARVIYEVEFNWYDNELKPITVVREVQSGKVFSISGLEIDDFKEYSGADVSAGNSL